MKHVCYASTVHQRNEHNATVYLTSSASPVHLVLAALLALARDHGTAMQPTVTATPDDRLQCGTREWHGTGHAAPLLVFIRVIYEKNKITTLAAESPLLSY